MKTELTISESNKLIELGINPELASIEKIENIFQAEYNEPRPKVFALDDIIKIIPKSIDGNVLSILATSFNYETEELEEGWSAVYVDDYDKAAYGIDTIFCASELIDALYRLLMWCIEQNKINIFE